MQRINTTENLFPFQLTLLSRFLTMAVWHMTQDHFFIMPFEMRHVLYHNSGDNRFHSKAKHLLILNIIEVTTEWDITST